VVRASALPLAEAAKEDPGATHRKTGHDTERQQYTRENKGIYNQIADVIPEVEHARRGSLRPDIAPGEQALGGVGSGGRG